MIITKSNKDCAKNLDFTDKIFMAKFLVQVRDIHKIEKKNSIGISIFGQQNKEKHPIACSYVYKLVYAKDKFSKPFKIYLDEDAVCNSINMIKEGKYCNQLIKKVLMKNL